MSGFTIRTLRRDEIEQLLDQLAEVAEERRWIASEPPIPRERWREGFERRYDDEYATILVSVDEEDRIVGHLSADARKDRAAEIGMAVSKEWRGRGVGSALLQACIDWARETEIHKLALQVWPHNEAAIRLYEKFGFEREGVLRSHYRRQNGELWDAIVMGLLL
ncbi:MAG: GNAT family N-acetyltransferase [Actinobacteria bacterium]|nr:MAG: GNAT family N-acetyltransferase [Actinomycetota bacterium]